MSDERTPHVYRSPSGDLTWMCPSRKKGFVWLLLYAAVPNSWGGHTDLVMPMLIPIEDWIGTGWVADPEEERTILTSGLGSWLSSGWQSVERWP